ncbi:hypothetical protein FHS04_000287 [Mesoflavibacter sabulilitoris]|uniref:Uncharacterized protein n=1 Tax=Mesoflavibacter zeaxanthinifaciens subsp. sabulilitoris TaxID=1520893 RepID=A0A2T1NH14_9FLAO|nr:hypothetical protein [Mesoflavibacter zeaxanthinifaciens]MBB3122799.1 hypothetical protein [Mesoflavibacter zeaxanthinifaciens subsp. sabulilitoris]PSG92120.1 hypothetical protein C7H61_05945 [Mesoflavibacter zeaxanthinifaciens subsp. sabulilitoris]
MKRILYFFIILLIIALGLLYWSTSSTDQVFKKAELINIKNINSVDFKTKDSVLVAASDLYQADEVKKLMQGEQYRKAWSTPVKVPVMYLDTLFGGVTIEKEGGGKQTHSLKLKTKNDIELTLRSVNKDPEALIPEFAKTLGLENIVVDGISAQHPYAAILVAKLADYAKVHHTRPKLVFVPKQKTLKNYNDKYGNRLFLLEYETESKTNWTKENNVIEILDTDDLQELKLEQPEQLSIDKKALIRVRLFDLLIGDWDRHTKQWGWIVKQEKKVLKAIPIAGDRDNAFFSVDGVLPTILSDKNVVPELRPFTSEIDFMPGLVYPFDQYFLINTSEELFVEQAKQLQKLLTDEVLEQSLSVWPKQIAEIDGEEIISKIKSRRDHLIEYAKQFKVEIDKKGVVNQPLKGSEDINLPEKLLQCFECNN